MIDEKTPYNEILHEINRLKELADKARESELADVIYKVKESIKRYGLTAKDLGLDTSGNEAKNKRPDVAPKYRGPDGQEWSGRGKNPRWLTKAVESGSKLTDFTIDSSDSSTAIGEAAGNDEPS